jgi:lincosamide nucleotidyltransferase A/C/D/E
VQLWVDGGWGVDALLGQQTRPHKDLDALVVFDGLPALAAALAGRGFQLKEIWSENRWAPCPAVVPLIGSDQPEGRAVATAFVLRDAGGLELDVHAVRFDERGDGVATWDTDFVFPAEAFEGRGVIAGTPVRCLSAAMHMQTHIGYTLKDKDIQDLRNLHERFGVAYHKDQAHLFSQAEG